MFGGIDGLIRKLKESKNNFIPYLAPFRVTCAQTHDMIDNV
jgi:hypothetical protein